MPAKDDEFDTDSYLYGDDDDAQLPNDVSDIADLLRETLTDDMAEAFIRSRFQEEVPDDPEQYQMLVEELIAEAFNDGYDSWDDFPG